jgi:hypothetical protein
MLPAYRDFIQACKPNPNNSLVWLQLMVMLAGLVWFQWEPAVVLFAYFFETIIIGVIHVGKMFLAARFGPDPDPEIARSYHSTGRQVGYYLIPFFLVHYFFFVFVQSVFVFAFFGSSVAGVPIKEAFQVPANYWSLLQLPDMQLLVFVLLASQLAYTLRQYIATGMYRKADVGLLMMQPYLRIVIQQFVAILGGFFLFFTDAGMAAAVLLILFRAATDLALLAARDVPEIWDNWVTKLAEKSHDPTNHKKRLTKWVQALLSY